ncbi:carbohydrate ABC transporter permease [Ruminiclostridium cellobioparum]|uniref:ABC-type sugar transport system, permease component n=1 Tax=Ruminiclostridium cellobioparum subsp. termitidis CT1112 TaxID=1195236 RepID=S0FFT8_RUMCE|nr:carbohydrate ABC transporter permease [Ruminiclostridium cellobioparum]EMS69960.1 ABC-type sugar transport system, permease component [Ruminiclostridium cellobioparum subsp. termitidis CT1112]
MKLKTYKKKPRIVRSVILIIVAVIQLFPLYWMLTFSLKGNNEIFGGNILGLPKDWRWDNYANVFNQTNIPKYLMNSIIVTAITIVFTLLLSAMVTYAIVRLKWFLSKTVYILFLVGMMLPIHAVLLPLFVNLKPVMNTYAALILPYVAFAMPLSILIMVGSLEGIPRELEEAAFIDGANIYKIFFNIIMPLLSPTMATVAILTFLSSWNEMMLAVTFISNESFKTITTGVLDMVGKYSTKWGLIGAGLVVATIPTIIMYILLSDNVQKSLAAGAVKG